VQIFNLINKIYINFYCKFQLFTAPANFKPKNLKLRQTSSDYVRLDWDNPYTDVEANYQVCVYVVVLLIRVHIYR